MKKIFSLLLVFILSLQLFTVNSVSSVSANNTDDTLVYIAIGDSLTEADPGFVTVVGNGISADYTINYGVSGITSYQLLIQLRNNEQVRNSLTNADIITLDIGSNDIFYQVMQNVSYALGCEPGFESISNAVTSMQSQYNNAKGFAKLIVGAKLICKVLLVRNSAYNTYKIQQSSNTYKSNLSAILDELESLAPNAKIYIGNLYNPYVATDPIKIAGYNVFDVDEMVELWESRYNAVINEVASDCVIVDIHNVITSKTQLNADVSKGYWDPHPNAQGYKDMGNAFLRAMK